MVPKINNNSELNWTKEEQADLESRILKLRDDQIVALFYLVKISFAKEDIKKVVAEIRRNTTQSGHLPILIFEASSKEELLWWIDYFEEKGRDG